jgi:hypothetical protein
MRMIRFTYHGKDRLAELHDHGILNGSVQLLSWQVAGASTRPLPNWLLTRVDEITGLVWIRPSRAGAQPLPANISTGTCCSSESNRPTITCGLAPNNRSSSRIGKTVPTMTPHSGIAYFPAEWTEPIRCGPHRPSGLRYRAPNQSLRNLTISLSGSIANSPETDGKHNWRACFTQMKEQETLRRKDGEM